MQNQALVSFGSDRSIFCRRQSNSAGIWLPRYPACVPEETRRRLRDTQPIVEYCVLGCDVSVLYLWKNEKDAWYYYLNGPRQLHDWLLTKTGPGRARIKCDVESLHLTLGPKDSFYAHDRLTWSSYRLPDELVALLHSECTPTTRPVCVALGVNGAWACIDSAYRVHKSLKGYDELDQLLDSEPPGRACYISLSPNEAGHFFAAFEKPDNGEFECRYKVPSDHGPAITAFIESKPNFKSLGPGNPLRTKISKSSKSVSPPRETPTRRPSGEQARIDELEEKVQVQQRALISMKAENEGLHREITQYKRWLSQWATRYESLKRANEELERSTARLRSSILISGPVSPVSPIEPAQPHLDLSQELLLQQHLQAQKMMQQELALASNVMAMMNGMINPTGIQSIGVLGNMGVGGLGIIPGVPPAKGI